MNEVEEKMAAKQIYDQARGQAGCIGMAQMPMRPGLRERIENQKFRSERESQNVERLRELSYLLDKYPDTARILELLETVKD